MPADDPARHAPRIMIADDAPLVTAAMVSLCAELGWTVVGPAHTLAAGLELADSAAIDAALLDASLGDAMAWGIAARLRARGIPFVFVTGHDLAGRVPAALADAPILRKPVRLARIETAIRALLAPTR